jgi:Complex I intermediate-associated protein 30 (CIA30)
VHITLAYRKDEWQDIRVPVVDFLLTTHGYLTHERRYINLRRVTGLGFAVSGGREVQHDGPFKFCIGAIEAGYDTDRSSGNED